jgi:hypothetical protein
MLRKQAGAPTDYWLLALFARRCIRQTQGEVVWYHGYLTGRVKMRTGNWELETASYTGTATLSAISRITCSA